jgi:hypothetical protein
VQTVDVLSGIILGVLLTRRVPPPNFCVQDSGPIKLAQSTKPRLIFARNVHSESHSAGRKRGVRATAIGATPPLAHQT